MDESYMITELQVWIVIDSHTAVSLTTSVRRREAQVPTAALTPTLRYLPSTTQLQRSDPMLRPRKSL